MQVLSFIKRLVIIFIDSDLIIFDEISNLHLNCHEIICTINLSDNVPINFCLTKIVEFI